MNPNAAVAPAPTNLMHDVVPPKSMQPMLASVPVAQPAPQTAPNEHPITGQPPQNATQPAASPPSSVAAKTPPKPAETQRTAHQPKKDLPILAISLAVLFALVMVAAAVIAYRQS